MYLLPHGALYHTWQGHLNLKDIAYPDKQQENNIIPCKAICFHIGTIYMLNTRVLFCVIFLDTPFFSFRISRKYILTISIKDSCVN